MVVRVEMAMLALSVEITVHTVAVQRTVVQEPAAVQAVQEIFIQVE